VQVPLATIGETGGSSSSSRSILKRREGRVYSSLLLLMSMSLGDPGSAMVEWESGALLEAMSARVQSAVNMLVGCKSGDEWSRVYSLN